MRIIIDSVDGLGKTTMCKKLSGEFMMGVYHPPRPVSDFEFFSQEIDKIYLEMIDSNRNCIFDRLFYSEYAYNFSREISYIEKFEDQLDRNDILIILTFKPGTVMQFPFFNEKYIETHERHSKQERFELINKRYMEIYEKTRVKNKIRLNINELGYDAMQFAARQYVSSYVDDYLCNFGFFRRSGKIETS